MANGIRASLFWSPKCPCWNIIWLHLFWFCWLVCDTQNAKLAISSLEANVLLIQRSKWLLNYRWVIFVEYFSTTLLINIRWALVSSFSDLWLSDNVFRLFSRCCLFKGSYTAYILITATNYTALWFIYWYETSYEFFVYYFLFCAQNMSGLCDLFEERLNHPRWIWSEAFDWFILSMLKTKFCFWSQALQGAWKTCEAFDHKRMYGTLI